MVNTRGLHNHNYAKKKDEKASYHLQWEDGAFLRNTYRTKGVRVVSCLTKKCLQRPPRYQKPCERGENVCMALKADFRRSMADGEKFRKGEGGEGREENGPTPVS